VPQQLSTLVTAVEIHVPFGSEDKSTLKVGVLGLQVDCENEPVEIKKNAVQVKKKYFLNDLEFSIFLSSP
jgi:hypothetical protein